MICAKISDFAAALRFYGEKESFFITFIQLPFIVHRFTSLHDFSGAQYSLVKYNSYILHITCVIKIRTLDLYIYYMHVLRILRAWYLCCKHLIWSNCALWRDICESNTQFHAHVAHNEAPFSFEEEWIVYHLWYKFSRAISQPPHWNAHFMDAVLLTP